MVEDREIGEVVYIVGQLIYSFINLSVYGQEVTVWGGVSVVSLAEVEIFGFYHREVHFGKCHVFI